MSRHVSKLHPRGLHVRMQMSALARLDMCDLYPFTLPVQTPDNVRNNSKRVRVQAVCIVFN